MVFLFCILHLRHVEPQTDGLALFQKGVEFPAVEEVIEVAPQSLQ